MLDDIARTRASAVVRGVSQDAGGNLGHYGVGASKWQLQPLIEQKIKDDSPSARRQRHSAMILNRRRGVFVFDRTKTTSALLRMKVSSFSLKDEIVDEINGQRVGVHAPVVSSYVSYDCFSGRLL